MLAGSSEKELEIVRDLSRTYPSHVYYQQRQGPGQRSLFNVLRAYSVYDRQVCISTADFATTFQICALILQPGRGLLIGEMKQGNVCDTFCDCRKAANIAGVGSSAVKCSRTTATPHCQVWLDMGVLRAGGLRTGHGLHSGPAAAVHV